MGNVIAVRLFVTGIHGCTVSTFMKANPNIHGDLQGGSGSAIPLHFSTTVYIQQHNDIHILTIMIGDAQLEYSLFCWFSDFNLSAFIIGNVHTWVCSSIVCELELLLLRSLWD